MGVGWTWFVSWLGCCEISEGHTILVVVEEVEIVGCGLWVVVCLGGCYGESAREREGGVRCCESWWYDAFAVVT